MTERLHKAARDGRLDVLRAASRRDINRTDDDNMTATLWAAFEGQLDALRLLVGRGGDPERCDHLGNRAIHLAAARGHLACVTFLVNFGASLWAFDLDGRSAQQLAALHGRHDVLRALDAAAARQATTDPRRARELRERAEKDLVRLRKSAAKRQRRADKERGRGDAQRFSQVVGVQRRLQQRRAAAADATPTGDSGDAHDEDFKVGEVVDEAGKRSTRSLTGLRSSSNILLVGSYDNPLAGGKRGRIADVFGSNNAPLAEPASIFDRPGFGSVAFRSNAITHALSALPAIRDGDVDVHVNPSDGDVDGGAEDSSVGSAGSLAQRRLAASAANTPIDVHWNCEDVLTDEGDDNEDGDEDDNVEDAQWSTVQLFLVSSGLREYAARFIAEKIDLEALVLLSDEDLQLLGLPLGPRRKLLRAIEQRRAALEEPGALRDSCL